MSHKKLHTNGIRGQTLAWVEDFLSQRKQSVVVEGRKSSFIPVESGVRQGSVLGPSLLLFYINDLPEAVKGNARLFADDTIIREGASNS